MINFDEILGDFEFPVQRSLSNSKNNFVSQAIVIYAKPKRRANTNEKKHAS